MLFQQRDVIALQERACKLVSYPLFSSDVEKAVISDTTLWKTLND